MYGVEFTDKSAAEVTTEVGEIEACNFSDSSKLPENIMLPIELTGGCMCIDIPSGAADSSIARKFGLNERSMFQTTTTQGQDFCTDH